MTCRDVFLLFHFCLLITRSLGVTYNSEIQYCTSGPKFVLSDFWATVIVSTLDGLVTALDGSDGSVLWSLGPDRGPLLSSTISNYKFPDEGKIVQLIPSLDGDLYTYDGKQMGTTPISADNLLGSSMKMHDDTVITGGKEIRTYGINRKTGLIQYSCGLEPCQYFSSEIGDDDILVLRQTTRTVRAVSSFTGVERWNYSVGQHEVNLASSRSRNGCHDSKQDFFSYGRNTTEDGKMNAIDTKYFQTDVLFNAADGHISVWNHFGVQTHTWEHTFNAPIVHAWKIVNQELQTLDIFKSHHDLNADCDVEESDLKHIVYVGSFHDQLFILQSNNLLKTIALEWKTFGRGLHSAPPQVTWQPYLSTAPSRTPILRSGPVPETAVIIPVRRDERSLAFAITHNEGEYPFDNGLYLLVGHPLNSSTSEDADSDDESTLDKIIIVSLWYWWKEVLAISVSFAVLINVFITRQYIRSFTSRFIRENTKQEVVNAEPVLHMPDPLPPSKALESQTSSDSSFPGVGTPPSEFVSRYFTDFEPIQTLGKGGFGVVFQARNKFDDCEYAIKRIRMPVKEESKKRIMREVKALAKLDHSGIVRYYNSWLESPPWEWQKQMDSMLDSLSLLTPSTCSSMECIHNSFNGRHHDAVQLFQAAICETAENLSNRKGMQGDFLPAKIDIKKAVQTVNEQERILSHIMDNNTDPTEGYSLSNGILHPDGDGNEARDSYLATDCQACCNYKVDSNFRSRELFSPSEELDSSLLTKFTSNSSGASFIHFEVDAQSYSAKQTSTKKRDIPTVSLEDCKSHVKAKARELALPFRWSFENPTKSFLYIQMQLCHKDSLKDWLCVHTQSRDRIEVLGYFFEIISAVEYVHEQGLMHRDLKPSNILFALDGSIKIGDFGLVTDLSCSDETVSVLEKLKIQQDPQHRHTNQVGTLMYMSPEQLTGETYDHKVDVYASGLILFELLVPFVTSMERFKVMTDARELKFLPTFTKDFPQESALVQEMLSPNAKDRPCATSVKLHPALQDFNPRPDYLWHRRNRSLSQSFSTSSSNTNSCNTEP